MITFEMNFDSIEWTRLKSFTKIGFGGKREERTVNVPKLLRYMEIYRCFI